MLSIIIEHAYLLVKWVKMNEIRSFCKEFFSVSLRARICQFHVLFLNHPDIERRCVMDFERLLSGCKAKACVMSVDILPDDRYGNIRIVAGNKAHCDDMMATMHKEFIPGSPYAEYFPQNNNFEDFCYRSALLGQPLHTYVALPFMNLWLNMFLLPLESDKEGTGYCLYTYEVTPNADAEQRASLSADTSATVLQTCIKLRGSVDIKKAMHEVIEDIRKICGSNHCCILLVNKDSRDCSIFSEAIDPASGMSSMEKYMNDGFYEIAGTWDDTLGGSTCVIVKNQQDWEWLESANPVWYRSLKGANVSSIVLFPLIHNDETMGYMWATNFDEENTVKIKETLELTTYFIASEIANYQLLQKLKVLSTIDMLTGVKNRNAMNNKVSDILEGRTKIRYPFSVVFTDLNGLKFVNDESGHTEGDLLLKKAAHILSGVFFDANVYRAGGDEFMILASGMDEEKLKERIKKAEERSARENVSISIGTYVMQEGEDIRTAMRVADERMYADKNAYYERNPDKKYR